MDKLKADEEAAAAEAIRVRNNNNNNNYNYNEGGESNQADTTNTDLSNMINDYFGFPGEADVNEGDPEGGLHGGKGDPASGGTGWT